MFGPAFQGPAGLILLLAYRFYTQLRVKREKGVWVDKTNSSFYEVVEAAEGDQDQFYAATQTRFRTENIVPIIFMTVPSLLAVCVISLAFEYAALSDINQGTIPCLFTLAGIYILIIFYFMFDERISCVKFTGMMMMLVCIGFLTLESS